MCKLLSVCSRNRVHYLSQKCFGSQVVSPIHVPKPMENRQSKVISPRPKVEESSSILNQRTPGETIDALRQEFSAIGEGKFDLFKDDHSGVAILTIDQVSLIQLAGF